MLNKEELENRKFKDVEGMQWIVSRQNGKSIIMEACNNAYKMGWNDAIDAIIKATTENGDA